MKPNISFLFILLIFFTPFANGGQGGAMQLSSPAFQSQQLIPRKYTCQGEDINPALRIAGIPAETKSLALIVDDPDAPGGNWDHWVVYNIPTVTEIKENSVPGEEGHNNFGRTSYGGPCPPSGVHRYFFKIYALDAELNFFKTPHKKDVLKAMEGHILDQTELIGLYKK